MTGITKGPADVLMTEEKHLTGDSHQSLHVTFHFVDATFCRRHPFLPVHVNPCLLLVDFLQLLCVIPLIARVSTVVCLAVAHHHLYPHLLGSGEYFMYHLLWNYSTCGSIYLLWLPDSLIILFIFSCVYNKVYVVI